MKRKVTEIEVGWGLRVGGPLPYLAWEFHRSKEGVKITESYHRAVRVVLIPLAVARKAGLLVKKNWV